MDAPVDLPDWLHEVRAGAEAIDALDLTRFTPPEDGSARPGAVLMLFGEGEQGGELLLTERAHDMRSHPGQVSFPGGSLDPGESVEQAALREAEEEVGLDPAEVRIFGRLPELWLPPSNFAVTPVLGWWAHPSGVHIASRAARTSSARRGVSSRSPTATHSTVTGKLSSTSCAAAASTVLNVAPGISSP